MTAAMILSSLSKTSDVLLTAYQRGEGKKANIFLRSIVFNEFKALCDKPVEGLEVAGGPRLGMRNHSLPAIAASVRGDPVFQLSAQDVWITVLAKETWSGRVGFPRGCCCGRTAA